MDQPADPHRLRRRHRRLAIAALAALVVGVGPIGCAPDGPTDPGAATGLVILTGQVGDTSLTVRDGEHPDGRPVPLPDKATAWVSVGRGNVLLATLIDGRLEVSAPLRADDPAWTTVKPTTVEDVPPDGPLYFGSWDPDGGVFVVLGGDLSAADGLRLVVVDPNLGGAAQFPVGTRTRPVPPAWIDRDRVAVATGTGETPTMTILDTATGFTREGPTGIRLLATSADAGVAATWTGAGSIGIQPIGAWLSGGTASNRIDPPEGTARPISMALDETGARLAVAWADADGAPSRVTIHTESADWARVATVAISSSRTAVVAWLR